MADVSCRTRSLTPGAGGPEMVDTYLRQLRIRLGELHGDGGAVAPLAGLFARLYEPFASMRVGERPGAWAAFVVAEGLRVEDLDSWPGVDVVRALSCALVAAGLKQVDVAAVTGAEQYQISRWWRDFRRPSGVSDGGSGVATRVRRVPYVKSSKAFAAEVVANAEAAAPDPESGLILAETQLESLPALLSEYQVGLAKGGTVGPGVDRRLRRIYRELVKAVDTVQVYGQQRGIRL